VNQMKHLTACEAGDFGPCRCEQIRASKNVLPFEAPPKLSPGQRPKRRTDAEMVKELDHIDAAQAAPPSGQSTIENYRSKLAHGGTNVLSAEDHRLMMQALADGTDPIIELECAEDLVDALADIIAHAKSGGPPKESA
jgi:hypothetical protein